MKIWSWRQAIEFSDLEGQTKLLLYTMANYMNEHGSWCYPSVKRLSEGCSCDRSTIFRHLKKAEEKGFVEKRKRNVKGQEWAGNEYRALMPSPDLFANKKEEKGIPENKGSQKTTCRSVQLKGSQSATGGVAQSDTNSPIELSNELSNKKELKSSDIFFEEFWKEYPTKIKKEVARKAYQKALAKSSHEKIMQGLKAYKANKPVYQAFAHATSWLNAERWNDVWEKPINNHTNFEGQDYDAGTAGFDVI